MVSKLLIVTMTIMAMLLNFSECGSSFFKTAGSPTDATDFWLASMLTTESKWFKGELAENPKLINNPDGANICRDNCVQSPTCNSFNLGESKPGEFFCELTQYHYTDTAMFVTEDKDPGFSNYSLEDKRIVSNQESTTRGGG